MQIVIDIPEKTINEIKDNAMFAGTIPSEILWDVTSAIVNGTPLPDNPTNGDMIKALFPMFIESEKNYDAVEINFKNDWWNTPYEAKER